jgi:hypothetical protein
LDCSFEIAADGSLRGEFVFVEQAAESILPADTPLAVLGREVSRRGEGRLLLE